MIATAMVLGALIFAAGVVVGAFMQTQENGSTTKQILKDIAEPSWVSKTETVSFMEPDDSKERFAQMKDLDDVKDFKSNG